MNIKQKLFKIQQKTQVKRDSIKNLKVSDEYAKLINDNYKDLEKIVDIVIQSDIL